MTMFDDREHAAEAKFARDQDMEFRIVGRRNRLLGQWASAQMGMTPDESESYAREVVHAEFEGLGDEDVVRKLLADLTAAGVDTSDAEICSAMAEKAIEARRQLTEAL